MSGFHKHTAAPWKRGDVHPYGAFGEDKPVKAAGNVILRAIHTGDEEETEANARLAWASPQLLHACEMAHGLLVQYQDDADHIEAARVLRDALYAASPTWTSVEASQW